jgi:hypothetical protein
MAISRSTAGLALMITLFILTLAAALLIVSTGIVLAATVERREARRVRKRLGILQSQSQMRLRH